MEPFRIHILGCGSALPTTKHNASSQIIEIREKMFMVDCGEGTQIQLRRSRVRFTKVSAVFISHLHGDHCFGLIGMISTFGMLGRTAKLSIYAPAEFEPMLQAQLQLFCEGLEFLVEFHAVNTKKHQVIYEDHSLTVETIPLQHRVACCGFLFREKATLPHIRRDMIDYYQIPISQINNIKLGSDYTTPDGEVIANSRLVKPSEPPRSYAYCSDTRYIPTLYQLVEGVTALYHESTYSREHVGRARMYYHSTAEQAAKVAAAAHVGQLILGHYSARYDNETDLLVEAQRLFPATSLSNEGKVYEI